MSSGTTRSQSRIGVAWRAEGSRRPATQTQRAIADFLDRETEKIDALVAKKQRLIELLQEKRTALISHAVTKGLDRRCADEGLGREWLGQIPAHWEAAVLRRVARLNRDTHRSVSTLSSWQAPRHSVVHRGRRLQVRSESREYVLRYSTSFVTRAWGQRTRRPRTAERARCFCRETASVGFSAIAQSCDGSSQTVAD